MPESHSRKAAEVKKQVRTREQVAERRVEKTKATVASPGSRRWVAPAFVTVGLLGVAWIVVYYIAGEQIAAMRKLGDWNMLIGFGLLALSFVLASFWK